MTIRQWLDAHLARVTTFGFRLRQLTAVFGVKNATSLSELLKADDNEQPYASVYGLHNLRWVAFDAAESGGVASIGGSAQVLVLSMVFDGNVEDVLAELMRVAKPRFCEIFSNCSGFEDTMDPVRFVERHRIACGYFFVDQGPLLKDDDGAAPVPDATRAEIEDAFEIQQRFERYYAEFGVAEPRIQREEYLRAFADEVLPLPLAPWERARSDEASATRRVMDAMRKTQDDAARRSNSGKARRGVHAKSHGLLEADIEVVDSAMRIGLFGQRRTYRALLRPSNGFSEVRKDGKRDARGLAVRVLIPPDDLLGAEQPKFITLPPSEGDGFQDFIMVNYPVFFSPDVSHFAMLLQAAKLPGLGDKLLTFASLSLSSGGLEQLWHFGRMLTSKILNPLNAVFHSETPYQLGPAYVAKYSVEPTDPRRFFDLANAFDHDGLSTALKETLRNDPIRLRLLVHVLPTNELPRGFDSLADVIEDATVDWETLGAKQHHVATITVHAKQDPTTVESMRRAEAIRFNPWHALIAHRPLGSLNRARWLAYRASQHRRSGSLQAAATTERQAAE